MTTDTSRRAFLKLVTAAGISVTGISFFPGMALTGNEIENPTEQTSHVVDVHHHILPKKYVSALGKSGITVAGGLPFPSWQPEDSLDVMDQNGISAAVTSISSPGIYWGDRSSAIHLARYCNDFSANLIHKYPDRFGAFAVLPLPDVKQALREMEYALDTLELDGIVLLSNVGGHYLGDPKFNELFFELNRRKAVVFIHPTQPMGTDQLKLQFPSSLIEFVFDTTRAVTNLIYSGTLERCPDIRFILAHAGGTVPYLAWRISLLQYQPDRTMPQNAMTYLKRFYYDTALSAVPNALKSLQELAAPSHILFGSDFPFAPHTITSFSMAGLKKYQGFNSPALKAVMQGNAMKLFPRFQKSG